MKTSRPVRLWLLAWTLYAGQVVIWRAAGGSFASDDRLPETLLILGIGTSMVTGLGAGLWLMDSVRKNAIKKWQGILAVLVSSVVSAITPQIILTLADSSPVKRGLAAAPATFVTVLFGVIAFVGFSIGIVRMRSQAQERDGT